MSRFVESALLKGDYKIAFSDPASNWDTYINSEGRALSIAKVPGCESTFFGDIDYIVKLIDLGHWDDEIKHVTEYGLEVLQGLNSRLYGTAGNHFGVLRFDR